MLNGNQIAWVNKVKYLGVHFCCNTNIIDFVIHLQKVL